MLKYHYLIPICLLLAMSFAFFAMIHSASPETPPLQYDIAAGIATYNGPNGSVTSEFELSIPLPLDQNLFFGPLCSCPAKSDVVANVEFKYALTDKHRLNNGRPLGETHHEEFVANNHEIVVSYKSSLVRDFPIRKDEFGFYYGDTPRFGSDVRHRFSSEDFAQLGMESISYFLTILPDAAHDQRRALLRENIIEMPSSRD